MGDAPKLAQRLAERIEREILDRRMPIGHRLGTEVELIRRYGVSRAVLREAIRLVERHQLAETRRGTGGGLFVAQPPEEAVAQVMCAYLESIGLEIGELFEAWTLVGTAIARLAATRAGRRTAELERLLAGYGKPAPPEEESRRFDRYYALIAELAESPALALLLRSLEQVARHVGLGLHYTRREALRDWATLHKAQLATADAISAANPSLAEERMARLFGVMERSFRRRKPRLRRLVDEYQKRGDVLAQWIADEIRRTGLVPGERIGSEAELTARYAVSRAALREAVRLLELHGVAQMRRGLGGGLIVAEPDPGWVIRSASGYLARLGLDVEHMKEARLLIEPAGAALAATRASEEELAQLSGALGEMLALEELESGPASRRLHEHIADLSGNRALGLFARVMITAAWGIEPREEWLPRGALKRIRDNDVGIVGALVQRDAERASRLLRDHLELTIGWWADHARGAGTAQRKRTSRTRG